jgi:hypothetical protein
LPEIHIGKRSYLRPFILLFNEIATLIHRLFTR